MSKPSCVKCEKYMHPEENGVYLAETAGIERKLYRVWMGDKWKCRVCGYEVVSGYGQGPIAWRHGEGIKNVVKCVETLEEEGRTIIYNHEK